MAEADPLQERLRRMQPPAARPPLWRRLALPAGMLAAGLAGGAYVATVVPSGDPAPSPLPTSEVREFQDDSGLDGFTLTENEPNPAQALPDTRTEVRTVADPQALADAAAARAALERARAELAAVRAELAAARANPETSAADLEALRAELDQLKVDMAGKDQALNELNRENLRLQSDLDLAAELANQTQGQADLEAQRLAELERRRAELEARRAEEEALLQARTQSAMVAYRSGGGGGTGEDDGAGGTDERSDAAERFRRAGRSEAVQAEVISEPSRTVVQGTLIEATLANAISSQLEGNVAATVSYDVWSMDMANVLIPRGSRLFGRYSSSIEKGQRRIMVAWDRVVTPDGQSVDLAAYGTDRVGRAGVTGRVNTRTLARFSAAAAVSIIGAAPAVLAAAVEEGSDDGIARDTAENIGSNASDAIGGVIKDYIDIPATISVDQGAVVMVMVNADLEMLP